MNSELIMQALEVMWKGMLSIFTVIIVLTILVYLINKFLKSVSKKELPQSGFPFHFCRNSFFYLA